MRVKYPKLVGSGEALPVLTINNQLCRQQN